MARSPRARARLAVAATKGAVVAALTCLALGSPTVQADGVSTQQLQPVPGQARLDLLMERFDCSTTGFGADVIPGSAVVRRDDRVRHVSFDDGWATFTGAAAGELLAVCRRPV